MKKEEIYKKFKDKLGSIKDTGPVVIVDIKPKLTKNGNKIVTFAQIRTDTVSNRKRTQAFFMGYIPTDLLLICRQPVSPDVIKTQNLAVGTILHGFNLCVNYKRGKPFYIQQKPLMNPETEEIITSGGEELYRNVILVYGEAEHTGLEYEKDEVEIEKVVV